MTEQRRGEIPPIEGSRTLARGVDRRRQIIAGAWIGGFIAVVLLVWVAVVAGGDDGTASPGDNDPAAATQDASGEITTGEEPTGPDPTDDANAAQDGERDDADAAGGAASDDGEPDGTDEPEPTELSTVTFDGVCTVEMPADEADSDPQPWDYDACVHAPLALTPGAEHWIVVRASLPGATSDAAAAERRADTVGPDTDVLWSSHYPSLNPDLWVVFEGPFSDVDAARDAAEAMGGSAYPRALSLDPAGR